LLFVFQALLAPCVFFQSCHLDLVPWIAQTQTYGVMFV
jgi:hypothetical protein